MIHLTSLSPSLCFPGWLLLLATQYSSKRLLLITRAIVFISLSFRTTLSCCSPQAEIPSLVTYNPSFLTAFFYPSAEHCIVISSFSHNNASAAGYYFLLALALLSRSSKSALRRDGAQPVSDIRGTTLICIAEHIRYLPMIMILG